MIHFFVYLHHFNQVEKLPLETLEALLAFIWSHITVILINPSLIFTKLSETISDFLSWQMFF